MFPKAMLVCQSHLDCHRNECGVIWRLQRNKAWRDDIVKNSSTTTFKNYSCKSWITDITCMKFLCRLSIIYRDLCQFWQIKQDEKVSALNLETCYKLCMILMLTKRWFTIKVVVGRQLAATRLIRSNGWAILK